MLKDVVGRAFGRSGNSRPFPAKPGKMAQGLFAGKPGSGRKNQLEAMEVEKLKIGTSGEIVAGPQNGLFAENRGELAFLAKPAKDVKS